MNRIFSITTVAIGLLYLTSIILTHEQLKHPLARNCRLPFHPTDVDVFLAEITQVSLLIVTLIVFLGLLAVDPEVFIYIATLIQALASIRNLSR